MVDGRVARLARRADRHTAAGDTEVTMPRQIERDGVRRLTDEGAQLVEVLPASEYAKDHLPGAVNLPLRQLEQQATAVLDRHRAVVVYCSDSA
jgi:rhodanese-related sulfurtransferase